MYFTFLKSWKLVVATALLLVAGRLTTLNGQTFPIAGNTQEAIARDQQERTEMRRIQEQIIANQRAGNPSNSAATQTTAPPGVNFQSAAQPSAASTQVQSANSSDPLLQAGIVLDGRNPNRMNIVRIIPNSPAFLAGLRPGDVITRVNGNPVVSISALAQSLLAGTGDSLSLRVDRNGG